MNQHTDTLRPLAVPPLDLDAFRIQGTVLVCMANHYELYRRVWSMISYLRREQNHIAAAASAAAEQSFEYFFSQVLVRGLVEYNRLLVAEARKFNVSLPHETPPSAEMLRVLADDFQRSRDAILALIEWHPKATIAGVPSSAFMQDAAFYLNNASSSLTLAAKTEDKAAQLRPDAGNDDGDSPTGAEG